MTRGTALVLAICLLEGLARAAGAGAQDVDALERLEQAEQRASQGDFAGAAQLFDDVSRRFPDDRLAPVALLRLAESRWRSGDAGGAERALAELRSRHGDAPSAAGAAVLEGRMMMVRAFGRDGLQRAFVTFGQVSSQFPRDVYPDPTWRHQAALERGRILTLLGEPDLAAAAFLTAVEDDPLDGGTATARLALADAFLHLGQWTEAAEVLQRVVDGDVADGATDVERRAAVEARHRLTLLHRTVFRPLVGQVTWTSVRQLQAPGEGWRDPIGVDVSRTGHVVVADEGLDLALTFDPSGVLLATTAAERLRRPWWEGDQAYVLDRAQVRQPLSGSMHTFQIPLGDAPEMMRDLRAGAVDPLGVWVLLDDDLGWVVRFDPNGTYLSTVHTEQRGEEIVDVAADRRGRLWLLDRDGDRVLRFGLDGVPDGPVVTGEWRRPEALTVDAIGNVYVLDRDAKIVDVFAPDGRLTLRLGPRLPDGTEMRSPRDVAVDASGRLYLADRDLNAVFVLE